jgi:hypothetical protein
MLKPALVILLIASVPIGSYSAEFLSGYMGFALVDGFLACLSISFIGAPIVGLIISLFLIKSQIGDRLASFLCASILCFTLSILGIWGGATRYSQGFEMALI